MSILALGAIAGSGGAVNRLFGTVAGSIAGAAAGRANAAATPPTLAVWNSSTIIYLVNPDGSWVFTDGNRVAERRGDADGNDGWSVVESTRRFPTSGKGYFEVNIEAFPDFQTNSAAGNRLVVGIIAPGFQVQMNCELGYYYNNVGGIDKLTDQNHYCSSGTVGVAVDLDAGKVWFTRNGSYWNTHGDDNPRTGQITANADVFTIPANAAVRATVQSIVNGPTPDEAGPRVRLNAGQDPFVFQPPQGFTVRLSEP